MILFDGLCNLCAGSVRFVIERDPAGAFDFASLQSEAARRVLAEAGRDTAGLPDSVVLVDEQGVHVRSEAALKIAGRLRQPWPLLAAFRILPRALRDAAYDFVARRRYGCSRRWQHTNASVRRVRGSSPPGCTCGSRSSCHARWNTRIACAVTGPTAPSSTPP